MTLRDLAQRILASTPCPDSKHCPFHALQEELRAVAALHEEDPVDVIREAIVAVGPHANVSVRVDAYALNKLLDRLVDAERRLTQVGKG